MHSCTQSILSTVYQPGAKWYCCMLLCIILLHLSISTFECILFSCLCSLFFLKHRGLNCVPAHLCVYLHVCVMQSEHLAALCFLTLAQTRESVDYWMQLQCTGQTIKIDSAFTFYHTPNIPEVKACKPWAAGILIMIENMSPEWGGILIKNTGMLKAKEESFCLFVCLFSLFLFFAWLVGLFGAFVHFTKVIEENDVHV